MRLLIVLSPSACLLRGLSIGTLIVLLMLYGCTPVLAGDLFGPQTNYCHVVRYAQAGDVLPDWGSREEISQEKRSETGDAMGRQLHDSEGIATTAKTRPPLRHFQADPARMWRLFSYELATLCLVALAGQFQTKH